jgi:dipeptidyl aminopeptidase/acylaminoacyl peptidase
LDILGSIVLKRGISLLKRLLLLSLLLFFTPFVYFGWLGWAYTHPEKKPPEHTPQLFELPFENITFQSADDRVTLRGWLIPAEIPHEERVVIFAHGYKENRESAKVALYMAKTLQKEGIASILFDFRGCGESDGRISSLGYYEKNDLIGAIDFAKRLGYRKIGLVGFSMGAATALSVAPQFPEVRAVVADSPFTDLDQFLKEYLHKLPLFLPEFILWEIKLLTGIDPEQVQPIQAIGHLHSQAVFLIHAQGDEVIPASESRRLQEASSAANTLLWVSPAKRHVGTFKDDPNRYLKRTAVFLQYHLSKGEPGPNDAVPVFSAP